MGRVQLGKAHVWMAEHVDPIDLEAQRGRVVVACASQRLCSVTLR